jgi:hypothetical protein
MMISKGCKPGGSSRRQHDQLQIQQQFLRYSPIQLFNLKPNENGLVEAELENLQNYSSVYLVAVDNDGAVSRNLNVQTILQNQEAGLVIPTKDLTQR